MALILVILDVPIIIDVAIILASDGQQFVTEILWVDALKMTDGKQELDFNACGVGSFVDSHSSCYWMMYRIVIREKISATTGQSSQWMNWSRDWEGKHFQTYFAEPM